MGMTARTDLEAAHRAGRLAAVAALALDLLERPPRCSQPLLAVHTFSHRHVSNAHFFRLISLFTRSHSANSDLAQGRWWLCQISCFYRAHRIKPTTESLSKPHRKSIWKASQSI